MLRIGRLKVRNFKSFRFIDIPVSSNFIALAGPNGSGKSNFSDGIRFALGETSLRSLRAKRVRDLIFIGSDAAEVTLYFTGEEKYELQRAIRKDGKIRYRLNGKTAKRYSIFDALKRHNLDQSGRNIIVQGEVQSIAHMHGKERRAILDSVAGIADFEEKKKEALRELETVSTRIKDANLVMGERLAFLEELRQEREHALAYQQAHTQMQQARATLLHVDLVHTEQALASLIEQEAKLRSHLSGKQAELNELELQLTEVEKQRAVVGEELQARQKTGGLIQKIEELRASMGSKKQALQDGKESLAKLAQEQQALEKEITHQKKDLQQLSTESESLRQEIQHLEKQMEGMPSSFSGENGARERVTALQTQLQAARERNIALETELVSREEMLHMKEQELPPLEAELAAFGGTSDLSESIQNSRRRVVQMEKELDDSFTRTKELNIRLAELDRELLECKENASLLRIRVSPALANPALQYIEQLKAKEPGIHGTVAELIEFDSKYAAAVEAAAGTRLLYVVVENAELAARLIAKMKTQSEGRVTFLPLREVRSTPAPASSAHLPLSSYMRFSTEVKAAIDFVFGGTLLVKDMPEARKLGVGKSRMVTMDGELFEPSGIITGGKVKTSLLVAKQLRALDGRIEEFKNEKTAITSELLALREHESTLRSKKAESEIELKTYQLQIQRNQEDLQRMKSLEERKSRIQQEMAVLAGTIQESSRERVRLQQEMEKLQLQLEQLLQTSKKAEAQAQEKEQEARQMREERVSRLSFLQASLEGKRKEFELRKQTLFGSQERLRQAQQDQKSLVERMRTTEKELSLHMAELAKAEEQIAHKSREMEKLFARMKAFEADLLAFGEKRGKKKLEVDRWMKDMGELEIKKATTQTHLEDLRTGYAPYQEIAKLDLPKDQLQRMLQEAESTLQGLGNVNMAAIEMYEKRKAELGETEEKIQKLGAEREAILNMMEEIEHHKREVFFQTFDAVAENFRGLFKHLSIGEGILYLDKPNDPFDAGLYIKLRRGNKEHPLDSLSGGENSLVALMFIFAMQFFKPSPFYILDEVDAALDKQNSKNLAQLISSMAKNTQFLVVTHNDTLMACADSVLGVAKVDGTSRIVGVRLGPKDDSSPEASPAGPAAKLEEKAVMMAEA